MTDSRNANVWIEVLYQRPRVDVRDANTQFEIAYAPTGDVNIREANFWVEALYVSVATGVAAPADAYHAVFDYRVRVAGEAATAPASAVHQHIADRVHVHETYIDGVDAFHVITTDRPLLQQAQDVIGIADAFHGVLSDNPEVGQITIRLRDAIHAHTADDILLDQNLVKPRDATHSLTDSIEQPFNATFAQHSVFDATHAHTANRVAITFNGFYIDDALHTHTATRPVAEDHSIQDAFHAHLADAPIVGPEVSKPPVMVSFIRR